MNFSDSVTAGNQMAMIDLFQTTFIETTVILVELYPPLAGLSCTVPIPKNNENSGYAVKLSFIIYLDKVHLSLGDIF